MGEGKEVAVIMSTYNGERFIREQIDSILNQTYKNIRLVIRDDGSTDSTMDIIKEYMLKHDNIELYSGENLGFIKSFFELLKITDSEYYSYADQDDVWLPNKIELAVAELDKLDQSKPNMCFGNSDYYDEDMKLIKEGEKNRTYSFLESLFSCVSQGMTMTINKTARNYIVDNPPKTCFFHDWWTYILCVGLGNVVYNNVTTVKYRRRKENATSEGQGYFRLLAWRWKNLFLGDGIRDITQQMLNFKDFYYFQLSEENEKIINLFASRPSEYTFKRGWKKATYPKRIRRNLFDDFSLRVLFLLGVI